MTHTWNKQEENDIDDVVIGWEIIHFVCIMKDGSLQKFNAYLDECADGSFNKHIDCYGNDDYTTDDIDYWIEMP